MMTAEGPEVVADAQAARRLNAVSDVAEEKVFVASSWQLMWWKFRKHKLAIISTVIVFLLYVVALFCEVVAPYDPNRKFYQYKFTPPSKVHIVDSTGRLRWPFVYGLVQEKDPETFERVYREDEAKIYPIRVFTHSAGEEYKLWGWIPTNLKLFGLDAPRDEAGIFVTGTDELGRDLFSRAVYGARLSLSIGLVGVFLSMTIGILLGGFSGYYGGTLDWIIQRVIEFLRSIPSIPLWMGLSAALPADWPVIRIYFGITVILSLIGWTGMARVVRGKFLSMREEDFVMAAQLAGAGQMRIIVGHMLPSFLSHIIASMTLAIPAMILSETSLSFLGMGLRDPAISWGVLLNSAQNVASIANAPWKLWTPVIWVVVSVLAMNFMGDGIRDAADPYAR
jgi:peptide/nickel transport system permease protein